MAFKVYRTFSGKIQAAAGPRSEQFRLYALYAWGTPFVFVFAVVLSVSTDQSVHWILTSAMGDLLVG